MDDNKALTGKITISRPSCSDGRKIITIEVVDDRSRVEFVEIELDLEGFAEAVTGLGFVPCRFELRRPDLVGMIYDHKQEFVPQKGRDHALAALETDGWTARRDDLKNHHRHSVRDGVDGHMVHFGRHVRPDAGNPKAGA